MGAKMIFQKLFSDAEGESHWEDIEVELEERTFAPPAKAIEVSPPEAVKQAMFLRLKSGWNEPIHPTPVAQKLICLSGTVRVTASDGEYRDIGPGDVWHMEDKHGKGHHTVVTSDDDFLSVIIQYE
jgi:quercetin dioxygenase-like cupin family protein